MLEEHVIASACKQARFATLVDDDQTWSADIDAGTLTIGGRRFSAEVAGTASQGTFLWGWEHPSVPPERATLARRVRARGEGIAELSEPEVSLDRLEPLAAAILSVGLAEADAWWFGDAGDATVLFLVADERLAREPLRLSSLPLLLGELIGAVAFDHRRAFEQFAERPLPGVAVTVGEEIELTYGDERVVVRFDELGRIGAVESAPVRRSL